ncbi:hypothetical protein DFH07DRAFT_766936 [Mycena maculata]|uniref:Uncharacterized protein n=1 Tax=Mycena maculata TaxID=230809 RepID=A0AAD7K0X1_9AGAR|nr:hypothetical protein DFH07DRAFT_766936 [Mycena maculata]
MRQGERAISGDDRMVSYSLTYAPQFSGALGGFTEIGLISPVLSTNSQNGSQEIHQMDGQQILQSSSSLCVNHHATYANYSAMTLRFRTTRLDGRGWEVSGPGSLAGLFLGIALIYFTDFYLPPQILHPSQRVISEFQAKVTQFFKCQWCTKNVEFGYIGTWFLSVHVIVLARHYTGKAPKMRGISKTIFGLKYCTISSLQVWEALILYLAWWIVTSSLDILVAIMGQLHKYITTRPLVATALSNYACLTFKVSSTSMLWSVMSSKLEAGHIFAKYVGYHSDLAVDICSYLLVPDWDLCSNTPLLLLLLLLLGQATTNEAYLSLHSTRLKRQIRRKNKTKRALRRAGYMDAEQQPASLPLLTSSFDLGLLSGSDSDSLDSSVGSDSDTSESSDMSTSDDWSDLLGTDWRGSGTSSSSSDSSSVFTSDSDSGDADNEMPDLLPLSFLDSDDEDEDSSSDPDDDSSSSDSSSGSAIDQWDWDNIMMDAGIDLELPRSNNPLRWIHQPIKRLSQAVTQIGHVSRQGRPSANGLKKHYLKQKNDVLDAGNVDNGRSWV